MKTIHDNYSYTIINSIVLYIPIHIYGDDEDET